MSRFFHFFPFFNIACSVGLLFVCSFMEIWQSWTITICILAPATITRGETINLWIALNKMYQGEPGVEYLEWIFVWHQNNWITAGKILLIGFVLGWVVKAMIYYLIVILQRKYKGFIRAEEKRLLLLNSGNPITHQ